VSVLYRLDWLVPVVRSPLLSYALPISVALAVLALGCLVRLPEWRQLQQIEQAQGRQLSEDQEAKTAQVLASESIREAIGEAELELLDHRWRLAAGGDISDLLDQLAASGHAHGLHFEQLDVQEEVKMPGFRRTPLDVLVVGRYASLRMWLDDWLGQVRLLRAGDLYLASAAGKPGLLRLRLRVNAFQADGPVPEPGSLALTPARADVLPPVLDPFSAWSTRVAREGLANVPLARLEMVGSLSRGLEYQAVLSSAGRLYRVRAGDALGRDEGVVSHVGERQVEVRERLFVGGRWRERSTLLTLRKGVDREVREDDERLDDVADVGRAADAVDGRDTSSR